MKYILVIFLLCNASAGSSITLQNDTSRLMAGIYYGESTFSRVFIKVTKDIVIVDWFIVQKKTFKIFEDTIFNIKKEGNIFQGKISALVIEKGIFYIKAYHPSISDNVVKMKIEFNNEKARDREIYKNRALFQKDYSDFYHHNATLYREKILEKQILLERHFIRDSLITEHNIREKIITLNHEDFLIEYEKFIQGLEAEFIKIE